MRGREQGEGNGGKWGGPVHAGATGVRGEVPSPDVVVGADRRGRGHGALAPCRRAPRGVLKTPGVGWAWAAGESKWASPLGES